MNQNELGLHISAHICCLQVVKNLYVLTCHNIQSQVIGSLLKSGFSKPTLCHRFAASQLVKLRAIRNEFHKQNPIIYDVRVAIVVPFLKEP